MVENNSDPPKLLAQPCRHSAKNKGLTAEGHTDPEESVGTTGCCVTS